METKVLILYSTPHTGSQHIRRLLSYHPKISNPVRNDHLVEQSSNELDTILTDELLTIASSAPHLMFEKKMPFEYLFLTGYVHDLWLPPIIAYRPFEFKLIATLRHPYKVIRSHMWQGEPTYNVMGTYLNLVHTIKHLEPSPVCIPVDLWQDYTPQERLDQMQDILTNYLNLDMDNDVSRFREVTEKWEPHGTSPTRRELTSEEERIIKYKIEKSMILEKLREIGVNYGKNHRKLPDSSGR